MPGRERGLALVTVLLLLALLLVLAMVVGERTVRMTRDSACNGAREQALQAAAAAVEWARLPLAATYRDTQGWRDYLAAVGSAERYAQEPAFRLTVGGNTAELFVRDNADGDDDPRRDNDLKVYVLARVRTSLGPEALVESLCRLDGMAGGSYAQGRGSALRDGQVAGEGPDDLATAARAEFRVTE
jgi:hypothetical protein